MEFGDFIFSASLGLGLAAACGFRIFVPLLLMNLAHQGGYLSLADSFSWIGSTPALVVFASATVLEIGAYYIPVVDNLLDTVAGPSAVVAGVMATGSQVVEMDPLLGWTVAIVGGGGVAGVVQGLTTVVRGTSTLATAGFGNPLVSTVEAGASVFVTLLAITVPLIAVLCLLGLLFFAGQHLLRRRGATPELA